MIGKKRRSLTCFGELPKNFYAVWSIILPILFALFKVTYMSNLLYQIVIRLESRGTILIHPDLVHELWFGGDLPSVSLCLLFRRLVLGLYRERGKSNPL